MSLALSRTEQYERGNQRTINLTLIGPRFFWYRSFEGARPEKGLKILTFLKISNKNLNFWLFSKNFYRNELQSPILPYFDTQHPMVKFSFFFFLFVEPIYRVVGAFTEK